LLHFTNMAISIAFLHKKISLQYHAG